MTAVSLYLSMTVNRLKSAEVSIRLSGDKTEDMKKIKIIDSLDLIRDDIKASFEENYINVVNSHENKMLFIGAVNQYFKSLQ